MKRIYTFVAILAFAALACSFGRGQVEEPLPAEEVQTAPESTGGDQSSSDARPTLPVIEAGDCSASAGPGVDMAKCDMTELNYSGTDFSGANLAQAIFSNSNFGDANFTNANLAGVFASETNLLNAKFTNANLTNADMRESNLINADFTGATTTGVDFSGSNMTGAIITEAQLDQAFSIKGAILPDGSFGQ